jgi:hypothetical protein
MGLEQESGVFVVTWMAFFWFCENVKRMMRLLD